MTRWHEIWAFPRCVLEGGRGTGFVGTGLILAQIDGRLSSHVSAEVAAVKGLQAPSLFPLPT